MRKLLLLSGLFAATITHAQFGEAVKAQLVRDWERAKAYTKEYHDAMPKDKYDFRANDSVRSFAQQMLHLAQANMGLSSNGTARERIWVGRNLGTNQECAVTRFCNLFRDGQL